LVILQSTAVLKNVTFNDKVYQEAQVTVWSISEK